MYTQQDLMHVRAWGQIYDLCLKMETDCSSRVAQVETQTRPAL